MEKFVLNCETCGGPLEYSPDGLTAVCPYCGNTYNFRGAKTEALTLALNRANAMRIACDFDGAIREYRLITERNPHDSEALWGLALSTYGIEYVRDPRSGLRVPTCRRTVKGSILQDENYINAVKYAAPAQAEQYRQRAAAIERLQTAIKRRLEDEADFDVFLSFRSTDDEGRPTKERVVARRIYDELTRRGIKTFMSEVTLKGRLGEDYEPIIYKALYSCKFFILIACSAQNINSPWVKNEWSRFRDREEEERLDGACCAVFENISPSDLPAFLRSRQGVNLAKYPAGGYEIELADGLQARFSAHSFAREESAAAGFSARSASIAPALARAWQDLSDELYESAYTKFMRILDEQPENGEAWWGCFLARHNAYSAGLAAQNITYEGAASLKNDRLLKNAERYGNGEIKGKVASFRKMCAFRCGELAAECERKARDDKNKVESLSSERANLVAEREKTFRKLEKKRAESAKNPKTMTKLMGGCGVAMLLMFGIIGGATGESVIIYVGFGMLFMCISAGAMASFGLKHNIKAAKEEVSRLEGKLAAIDERLGELGGEREAGERDYEEQQRKAETFRNVFKNFSSEG